MIALAGAIASGEPVLHAQFDLAELRQSPTEMQRQSRARYRYRGSIPDWDDGGDDDGVQVKLHVNRVKVKVPLPSI